VALLIGSGHVIGRLFLPLLCFPEFALVSDASESTQIKEKWQLSMIAQALHYSSLNARQPRSVD
jgi:hypothetical protein